MEHKEEYHDPDYPEAPVSTKDDSTKSHDSEKIDKIKTIICREFDNEIGAREDEINDIEQKSLTARRLLHRMRYEIVTKYFNDQKLQMTPGQIQDEIAMQQEPRVKSQISNLLRDGQRNIHPSVKKLLGKNSMDIDEIFKHRAPRNTVRRDYLAMVKQKNYTIQADESTSTLRPESLTKSSKRPSEDLSKDPSTSKPKKVPRHIEPKLDNVVTLEEVTRNKQKHRYRIIIGNTSIYCPSSSSADKSTHKWLVYVRSAQESNPNTLRAVLSGVTFTLHHSYAPHHIVHVDKPPFHISRRGWGEFTAQITLHFAMPDRNRPATVEHNVKLDRNYTGLQTLGAETIVDVWLYSNQEMLQYEFKDEDSTEQTEHEPDTDNTTETQTTQPVIKQESWLDFFDQNLELDVDEMLIKPNKSTAICNVYDDNITIKEEIIEYPDQNQDLLDFDQSLAQSENLNDAEIYQPHEVLRQLRSPEMDTSQNDIPQEILNLPNSPKKRIMKYIDPKSGKIYYLEIDRNLDLSKIQEIVINSNGSTKVLSPTKNVNGVKKKQPKKGVSLLKPEVKSLLKTENKIDLKLKTQNLVHIVNDHCYLGAAWSERISKNIEKVLPTQESSSNNGESARDVNLYQTICKAVKKFSCYRSAVNYLLKMIPLFSERANEQEFVKFFPFVVESESLYSKHDFAKRRNIEWSRARLIKQILSEHSTLIPKWRTKQILLYSRLHGYYPIRIDNLNGDRYTEENYKEQKPESNIKQLYKPEEICSLTKMEGDFDSCVTGDVDLTAASDVEVDVDSCQSDEKVKKELSPLKSCDLPPLPVEEGDERSMYLYLERRCSEIGVELRNEDVGSGYSYSAVHAVLLSAMKSFAEDLIRQSVSCKLVETARQAGEEPIPVWTSTDDSVPQTVNLEHVWSALKNSSDRLSVVTNRYLGTNKHETCPL